MRPDAHCPARRNSWWPLPNLALVGLVNRLAETIGGGNRGRRSRCDSFPLRALGAAVLQPQAVQLRRLRSAVPRGSRGNSTALAQQLLLLVARALVLELAPLLEPRERL